MAEIFSQRAAVGE